MKTFDRANVKVGRYGKWPPIGGGIGAAAFFAHWKKNNSKFLMGFLNYLKTPIKPLFFNLALGLLYEFCCVWFVLRLVNESGWGFVSEREYVGNISRLLAD
jgi:hypothetical protein